MAIRRLEEELLWPGAVAADLAECRRYLEKPGRFLPDPEMNCSHCDPLVARDCLEAALLRLPRGARTDLGRIVAKLDAEFDRRFVPLSPHLVLTPPFGACGHWRRRFMENY
ncbi:hypothetical protein [Streptomyces sp. NPDC056600]|uniref:hypothetical protein n=1 Tax=Streptomyces sp. NPDC056600 TaxID=3345874 RepID=UPI0036909F0A